MRREWRTANDAHLHRSQPPVSSLHKRSKSRRPVKKATRAITRNHWTGNIPKDIASMLIVRGKSKTLKVGPPAVLCSCPRIGTLLSQPSTHPSGEKGLRGPRARIALRPKVKTLLLTSQPFPRTLRRGSGFIWKPIRALSITFHLKLSCLIFTVVRGHTFEILKTSTVVKMKTKS